MGPAKQQQRGCANVAARLLLICGHKSSARRTQHHPSSWVNVSILHERLWKTKKERLKTGWWLFHAMVDTDPGLIQESRLEVVQEVVLVEV